MNLQVECPRCCARVTPSANGQVPTYCPSCACRLTCPNCHALLSCETRGALFLSCPACGLSLGGIDTIPRTVPTVAGRAAPAPRIPGFEVQEQLGRGGMGVVYRAWQASLDRFVALKVLPPALAADPQLLERFRQEAALAAKFVDAHVVPVYEIVEVDGVPVIVMPLIAGGDVGRILRDRAAVKQGKQAGPVHPWATLDDRDYLDRMLPLLDQAIAAVAALHRGDVLHRDIKPSNILLEEKGHVWLSDFGLARLLEEGTGTQPGQGVGTPGYASPEQARGETEIDVRTDLFSLGATLYQALTLELPFGRTWPVDAAAQVVPPSRLQPLLSHDFDAVVLKALEYEPDQRYASAAEFQEDWQRVRQGLLPRARLAGPLQRLGRAVRRRWQVAALLAVACLVALIPLGLLLRAPPSTPSTPLEPMVERTVSLDTTPSGARVALVPLHPETGEPLADKAIRPQERTPLTVERVPAGEYLIVAMVDGHGFHEVYRIVPRPGQAQEGFMPHARWQERSDGTVVLSPVAILRDADVTGDMVLFSGGDFQMGSDTLPGLKPHPRTLAAYYLDTTEVTMKKYRETIKNLPAKLLANLPAETDPVRWVTFDQALTYAERIGKRLPDEAEYEFAATNGGRTRFPWGDDADRIKDWPFEAAGKLDYDKTNTNPPVFGLFSNVAEWTSSPFTLYPGRDEQLVEALRSSDMGTKFRTHRIVRGGPSVVSLGSPEPRGKDRREFWDPRWRYGSPRDGSEPGLGFRCARSERPRILDP